MKLYRRLSTVSGAAIPVSYGILWSGDWIKAACVDESRGQKVLWTGPERSEPEVAVADAWAHATGLERNDSDLAPSKSMPKGYSFVTHTFPAKPGDHINKIERFQAVFELRNLGPDHAVEAEWTGELKDTRPAVIADAWIHASGYEPEATLH